MKRAGRKLDVRAALARFYGAEPDLFRECDPSSREGVVRLLDHLRGGTPVVQLAAKSGFSRHQIARWLAGQTEPRLPEWFALIEATSLRLLDFIAAFFEPSALPSVALEWRRLQAARESVYARPESHVVLRFLELDEYRATRTHRDAAIAKRVALSIARSTPNERIVFFGAQLYALDRA
jgi:DNA-binding phage protein